MAQSNLNWIRCFLCRRKNSRAKEHRCVDTSICPVSKKSVKEVLHYLGRSVQVELHISRGEFLCLSCHGELLEYDATFVRMLQKQRNLSRLVEKAAVGVDSDFEQECDDHMATLNELSDEHYFDDVDVSDGEMNQTLHEAMGRKKTIAAPVKNRRRSQTFYRKPQNELVQCTFCAMRFRSKLRMQKHVSQAHKKFSCEVCSYSHRNEDYVLLHMNLHEGRNENQCRFCDKDFTTKISTIRHMEVHLDSKKYQCDKCGLCFSQTTVLYNHKLQHEAEEQPLRCEICVQSFKTKRTYRHHMITHRADRPRYSCEFCAKTFTEKYTLKVHKRTHPETLQQQQAAIIETEVQTQPPLTAPEPKFNCIICDQTFPNKDHLNKHMEKEHDVILKSLTLTNFSQYEVVTQESKKPCHICGQMFSAQTNLDYHLDNVHGVSFK